MPDIDMSKHTPSIQIQIEHVTQLGQSKQSWEIETTSGDKTFFLYYYFILFIYLIIYFLGGRGVFFISQFLMTYIADICFI